MAAPVTLTGPGLLFVSPISATTVSRAMAALVSCSVNQMWRSGPTVIPVGSTFGEKAPAVGTAYSVIVPDVVIRAMLLPDCSTYQRAPSGPFTIAVGLPLALYSCSRVPAVDI